PLRPAVRLRRRQPNPHRAGPSPMPPRRATRSGSAEKREAPNVPQLAQRLTPHGGTMKKTNELSRRQFVKTSLGTAAALGFPTIVPASVFGQMSPSNRINVGAIGVGRISRGHDLPSIWQFDGARIMAVCDLYADRVEQGKALINGVYAKKTG